MTTYRGKLEKGKVVFTGLIPPESDGTPVEVTVRPAAENGQGTSAAADDPLRTIGQHAVETGIKDGAAEHDHYIYGSSKRGKTPT